MTPSFRDTCVAGWLLLVASSATVAGGACSAHTPPGAFKPETRPVSVLPPPGTSMLDMNSSEARRLARDFERGADFLYCYFGTVQPTRVPAIAIDSVRPTAEPDACAGIGIAFPMRVSAPSFTVEILKGVLAHHTRFYVVSAIYRTEFADVDGERILLPRLYSIIRLALPGRVQVTGT